MASYIRGFLDQGSYPFMQPFLRNLILPHTIVFAAIVSLSELLIAISLLTGVLVRWASLGGLAMMLLFLFSSDGLLSSFYLFSSSLNSCAICRARVSACFCRSSSNRSISSSGLCRITSEA